MEPVVPRAARGGTGGGGSGMTYDISIGPVTLAPGEERIVCVDKKLPTTAAIDMVKITSEITQGGHHLVFYKSGATAEAPTPYTCQTFRDIMSGTVPLYIAQKSSTVLNFPTGVAYTMPAGQMVRVELHFLNTTAAPLPVTGTVHITDAVAGTITEHANLMFYGNLRIAIPPQSMATVGPTFRKFASAAPKIFGLTGHQHQRGTSISIELASAATGAGTPLYTNTNWSDPPLTIFDPPLVPTAGPRLPLHVPLQQPDERDDHLRRRRQPGDVLSLGVLLPGHGLRHWAQHVAGEVGHRGCLPIERVFVHPVKTSRFQHEGRGSDPVQA